MSDIAYLVRLTLDLTLIFIVTTLVLFLLWTWPIVVHLLQFKLLF